MSVLCTCLCAMNVGSLDRYLMYVGAAMLMTVGLHPMASTEVIYESQMVILVCM